MLFEVEHDKLRFQVLDNVRSKLLEADRLCRFLGHVLTREQREQLYVCLDEKTKKKERNPGVN